LFGYKYNYFFISSSLNVLTAIVSIQLAHILHSHKKYFKEIKLDPL